MDVQLHRGQGGTQSQQARRKGIGGLVAGAVMQLGRRRFVGRGLQGFQPGQKRCHANAAGNPYLPRPPLAPPHVKAAIRPFHTHALTRLQALRQAAGVVAQRLDLEADRLVALVGAGNGERMRALVVIKADKGKLARAVASPHGAQATHHRGDIGCQRLDRDDLAQGFAGLADATQQSVYRTVDA